MLSMTRTRETHTREHTALIDNKTIERLLAEHVAQSVKFNKPEIDAPGVSYEVRFEDETKGPQSHTVSIKAHVIIREDLMPQAEPL